jgi:hypothetical protein
MGYKESACLIFFGIRYLRRAEFDDAKDPRIMRAKAHGLSAWSGRRYPPVDPGKLSHFLLIGDRLTDVGYDGRCEDSVAVARLQKAIQSVPTQLHKAGFTRRPQLWVQCRFDGRSDWSHCWYTVFFGVRWTHAEDSDWETDPRMLEARKRRLQGWSLRCRQGVDDSDDLDEDNLWVIVGKRLALVGDGKEDSAHVSAENLRKHLEETPPRLRQAGLRDKPALWAHCDIDLGD